MSVPVLYVLVMTNSIEVGVTTQEALRKVAEYNVDGILINDISLLISHNKERSTDNDRH